MRRNPDVAAINDMTQQKLCIFAGTFDPVTFGHLDVLERATRLFDHVLVAVARNIDKSPLFSPDERVNLIERNLGGLKGASVELFDGLLVEFAIARKACAVIRGLRALSDFEFEFNMALMNRHLEPRIETVFVMPKEVYSYTSSTLVKQVARLGGDVTKFVPENVAARLREKFPR